MTAPEPPTQDRSPSASRRWLRRVGIGLTLLLTVVVVLVGLLQLPPVATVVTRRLLTLAPLNPGNRLEVGRVSGNFFSGLTLEDLRLRQSGRELGRIDRLRVAYHLTRLRPPESRIDALEIEGARLEAHRRGDTWDLLDVLRKSADTTGGGGLTIGRVRRAGRRGGGRARARFGGAPPGAGPDGPRPGRGRADAGGQIDALDLAVQPPASGRWFDRGHPRRRDGGGDPARPAPDPHRIERPRRPRDRAPQLRRGPAGRPARRPPGRPAARPGRPRGRRAVGPAGRPAPVRGHGPRARAPRHGPPRGVARRRPHHAGRRHPAATRHARSPIGCTARCRGSIRRGSTSRRPPASSTPGSTPTSRDRSVVPIGSARLAVGRIEDRHGRGAPARPGRAAVGRHRRSDALRGTLDSGIVHATGRARPFDSIPSYRLSGSAQRTPGHRRGGARAARAGTAIRHSPSRSGSRARAPRPTRRRAQGRVDLTAVRERGDPVAVGHATLRLAGGRLELRPELLAGGGRMTAVGTLRHPRRHAALRGARGHDRPRRSRQALGRHGNRPALRPLHLSPAAARRRRRRGSRPGSTSTSCATARAGWSGWMPSPGSTAAGCGSRATARCRAAGWCSRRSAARSTPPRPTCSAAPRSKAWISAPCWGRPDLAGPVTLHVTGEGRLRGESRSVRARVTDGCARGSDGWRCPAATRTCGSPTSGCTYDAVARRQAAARSRAGRHGHVPPRTASAYHVREGRLTSIDLGALLGRTDLRTDLNITFTADVAGSPGPTASAPTLALVLQPSRVNEAELDVRLARRTGERADGRGQAPGRGPRRHARRRPERAVRGGQEPAQGGRHAPGGAPGAVDRPPRRGRAHRVALRSSGRDRQRRACGPSAARWTPWAAPGTSGSGPSTWPCARSRGSCSSTRCRSGPTSAGWTAAAASRSGPARRPAR